MRRLFVLSRRCSAIFSSHLLCVVGVLSCSVLWYWAIGAPTARSLAGLRNDGRVGVGHRRRDGGLTREPALVCTGGC